MTFHLLDAVREEAPAAAVVVAASSELYGPPAQLPVDESAPLRPQNPYAVSKAGADLLAGFFADAHGLRIFRARAFNHAGPGQEPIYAIASFARQIAAGLVAGEAAGPRRHRQPGRAPRLHRRARRRARLPGARRHRRARRLQRLLGPRGLGRRAGRRARARRRRRGRPRRRRLAATGQRGDGGARLLRAPARRHGLGAARSRSSRRSPTPSAWWVEEIRSGRAPERMHE